MYRQCRDFKMQIAENGNKPESKHPEDGFWWIQKECNPHDDMYYLNKKGIINGIKDFKTLYPDCIHYRENDIVIENVEGLEVFEAGDYNNIFYKLFLNGIELF